ncbi:hypothetical protein GG344DRAFT_82096 [Lentinula edodes]|nr:hypothetical protein GG344DRAFT_82096 [Lentinula edodes]
MIVVEKIKCDITDIEDALQTAKTRRDLLCSVLHQEANQLNLTLGRAIRNGKFMIIELYPSHHLELVSRLKKAVCSASSHLLALINTEPVKLNGDSAILSLLLRMHEFPTDPSCLNGDTILTQALDLSKIGSNTVQALREYRISNTSISSTDEPSCVRPPCNELEKSEVTCADHHGDFLKMAWAAIDSFEQEGNKRLEDTRETLNFFRTRFNDHEEILLASNILVEDVAGRVYDLSSRDRPNTVMSYYHDPTIVQGFNHTISLNSLWMMVSRMMVGDQSSNPSLSTLLNKDPNWGIQLTENANIRYLLECQGVLSYPGSPPLQTMHLAPCPRGPLGVPGDIPLSVSRTPSPDLLHLDLPSPRSMLNSSPLSEGFNKLVDHTFGHGDLSLNPEKRGQDDYPTQHLTLLQEFALIQCCRNFQPSPESDPSCLGSELATKPATFLDDMDILENLEPFGECNDELGVTGEAPTQNSVTMTRAPDNGLECLIQLIEQVPRRFASASNMYISKMFRLSLPQWQGDTKEVFDLIVELSMYIGWIASSARRLAFLRLRYSDISLQYRSQVQKNELQDRKFEGLAFI